MVHIRRSAAVVAAIGAATLVTKGAAEKRRIRRGTGGWKSVTILAEPSVIHSDGVWPGPLQLLSEMLELRMTPAPAGRGTELHARVLPGRRAANYIAEESGQKPDDALRAALRNAKQIVETGEVLRVDPRPHGARPGTVAGAIIDATDSDARGKGLL